MFDQPIVIFAIILLLFALGEYLSIVSKARIPMLFVVIFGYLSLLWTGVFPEDLFDRANLTAFAAMMPAPLIVHMGTIIPFNQLKQQWKSVLIALSGIVVAAILIILIGVPIIGYAESVAGVGPLTGGTLAFIITSEKLIEVGLVSLITIPAIIMALQKFVGMALATQFLRRYALKLREGMKDLEEVSANDSMKMEEGYPEPRSFLPKRYQTSVILLAQVFLGGALAVVLGDLTSVNYSLWALAIGIIGSYTRFFVGSIMERANALGLSMALLIVVILSSMDTITFSVFIKYLPYGLLILFVGAIGIMIGGYLMSRFFKWDYLLGMPVALTALIGFPADYIISREVSRSIGRNEKEQKYIFDQILTPMLVGGFTTVTVASIVIASILIQTL